MSIAPHFVLTALSASIVLATCDDARGQTTIEYAFTSESTKAGEAPRPGHAHVTSTIDGPMFRNVSRLGNAVELSDDDGRTTHFGAPQSAPNTPLAPEVHDAPGPIAGWVTDEKLTVGESTPCPTMFDLPTRVYTVDYDYAIASRVIVIFNKVRSHEHFTFTVADLGVSSAALRVAFSRGYGHALCRHAEAFTGLPLVIDGTIESPYNVAHVRVEAEALQR